MKKILFLTAATLTLAACNNDDNYIDQPVAVQISATIGQSSLSRASGTEWAKGDEIGITMTGNDVNYVNMEYTTKDGDGTFTGPTMYFKNHIDPLTLTAYYPFAAGIDGTVPAVIETATTSDRQTSEEQPKFDFLYAKAENIKGTNPNVEFTFSHQMSKLTFIFKNGKGADVSKIKSYRIDGLRLKGTFKTVSGECAANSDVAAAPLSITMSEGTVKNEVAVPSLILFPQAAPGKTVSLTISDNEGQDYACNLSFENNRIESGNNYQFTITVNKTGLIVNTATITDWNTKESSTDASSINPK